MTLAASPAAASALALVRRLQARLVAVLAAHGGDSPREVAWLRDRGAHGGGDRRELADTPAFDRASVNVSQVHYDDDPARPLGSATALSAIVHPRPPGLPSMHVHVSWTERKGEAGTWRVMADLNPSTPRPGDADAFAAALATAAPGVYAHAARQGDTYFWIPALARHRGVTHFYLEGYATADVAADAALAEAVGVAAIDAYAALLALPPGPADAAAQLAYHTLYLFQVLTLDRGTTSGLLVHDENDDGILGSLPGHVDRPLLASWRARLPAPQEHLLDAILAALPDGAPVPLTVPAKRALAAAVRAHYRAHPEALALQAQGDVVPPTVANHT